jgi:hypothetical protein
MKKAIFINAKDKTVTEVELENKGTLQQMYKLIGCELVAGLALNDHNDLWIDDEGLLCSPNNFFTIKGFPQPLAGNAIILGVNHLTGKDKSATMKVEEVKSLVTFLDVTEVSIA